MPCMHAEASYCAQTTVFPRKMIVILWKALYAAVEVGFRISRSTCFFTLVFKVLDRVVRKHDFKATMLVFNQCASPKADH